MSKCLIKDSEYRTKLALSGVSELIFYSFANNFVQEHGRFPNLDEIPNSNSVQYLKDTLHIKDDSTSIDNILNTTGTESLEAATIQLNDTYSDLEIDMLPLKTKALVYITKRPSEYGSIKNNPTDVDVNPNMGVVFNLLFNKLRNLYGINLIPISNKLLSSHNWNNIPEIKGAAAFVYNGNIYVNTDLADADAPIHEMTHILLGSIRFKNPNLYLELVSMSSLFKSFSTILSQNPNKVLSDVLEETFVLETAKYLAGLESDIDLLDDTIKYELHYNIKRLLDSALMGTHSVKSISDTKLYNMSLKDLASTMQSNLLQPYTLSSLDDATLHRMLSNVKSDLMKKGDLREEC